MAYKKNPIVLPFTQPVHPRYVESDCFETRRHWRRSNNSKPKRTK